MTDHLSKFVVSNPYFAIARNGLTTTDAKVFDIMFRMPNRERIILDIAASIRNEHSNIEFLSANVHNGYFCGVCSSTAPQQSDFRDFAAKLACIGNSCQPKPGEPLALISRGWSVYELFLETCPRALGKVAEVAEACARLGGDILSFDALEMPDRFMLENRFAVPFMDDGRVIQGLKGFQKQGRFLLARCNLHETVLDRMARRVQRAERAENCVFVGGELN